MDDKLFDKNSDPRIVKFWQGLSPRVQKDLLDSGIDPGYAYLMKIHMANNPKHPDDYVIPYFTTSGTVLNGYRRMKLFREPTAAHRAGKKKMPPKYTQPPYRATHLYIPPNWASELRHSSYVVITEGEKKAAALAQWRIPVLGLGGVDSWRTGRFEIPEAYRVLAQPAEETEEAPASAERPGKEAADVAVYELGPRDIERIVAQLEGVVPELIELRDELASKIVFLIYDCDVIVPVGVRGVAPKSGVKPQVRRAAHDFADWLFSNGIQRVRQVEIPAIYGEGVSKVGLDDFVKEKGPEALFDLLWQPADPSAKDVSHEYDRDPTDSPFLEFGHTPFKEGLVPQGYYPVPANVSIWVTRQLNNPREAKRKGVNRVVRTIIAALDRRGRRFIDEEGGKYYFKNESQTLYAFRWRSNEVRDALETPFGKYLAREFHLKVSDAQVIHALSVEFQEYAGVTLASPRKVALAVGARDYGKYHLYPPDVMFDLDGFYYALNDTQMARITYKGMQIKPNGTDNVLFLPGYVTPVDAEEFRTVYARHKQLYEGRMADIRERSVLWDDTERSAESVMTEFLDRMPLNPWLKALSQTNLLPLPGSSKAMSLVFYSCLMYLSPWLKRWRGMMLPLELAIAEPGSGKTQFYNLRKTLWSGNASLDAMPQDIRDWNASIANSDGMWVGDNVGYVHPNVRNAMSEELARLITSDDPTIQQRQLYTNAENLRLKIDTTFAVTAITNPFTKEDILQRSVMLNFEAIPLGERPSNWFESPFLEFSREQWLAEYFLVIRDFFRVVKEHWNPNYKAQNRLAHFEQSIYLMGLALGYPKYVMDALVRSLGTVERRQILDSSPPLEGLRAFAQYWISVGRGAEPFFVRDMLSFFQGDLAGGALDLGADDWTHVNVFRTSNSLTRYINSHAYDVKQNTGIAAVGRTNNQTRYRIIDLRAATESSGDDASEV